MRHSGCVPCAVTVVLWGCAPGVPDYGFAAHLDEAIALNTERQPLYDELTGGESGELSQLLIGAEQITMSQAEEFDALAAPFHDEGIAIVAADFVSMKHVERWDRPPEHDGPWTEALAADLEDALAPLVAADPSDYEAVCAEAHEVLADVEALEQDHDVHLAMTIHVIESMAYGALHAIAYSEQSDGRTDELATDLAATQLEPLETGLAQQFDEWAAPLHALGAGILVNDVPKIPFAQEYERWLRRR